MGFEYKIRFDVPPAFPEELLAKRPPDPTIPGSEWVEYDYKLEPYGFYFVDHGGNRETSSVAFRCLVDAALEYGGAAVIEEL